MYAYSVERIRARVEGVAEERRRWKFAEARVRLAPVRLRVVTGWTRTQLYEKAMDEQNQQPQAASYRTMPGELTNTLDSSERGDDVDAVVVELPQLAVVPLRRPPEGTVVQARVSGGKKREKAKLGRTCASAAGTP